MNILQALILGIVQGLTEFLPISSSGHLALLQNYFGEVSVGFDVVLHFATLLAILVYFAKDIVFMARDFFSFDIRREGFRTAVFLVIATIPIVIVGWFFRNLIYSFFSNLYVVAMGFIISGMFLFTASFSREKRKINAGNSFLIGISQALALIPGVSRSGATVSTGILAGISREKAIRFSFLLAIPAIFGALIVNLSDLFISNISVSVVLVGFLAAFLAGLLAIFIFVKFLNIRRFRILAYYLWILGIGILIRLIL